MPMHRKVVEFTIIINTMEFEAVKENGRKNGKEGRRKEGRQARRKERRKREDL